MRLSAKVGVLMLVCLWASAAPAASKEDHELQVKCGEKAHNRFKEVYGAGDWKSADGTHNIYSQQNHHNRKLNKCFMLMSGTSVKGKNTLTTVELWDINEGKYYGSYLKEKDNSEETLLQCRVDSLPPHARPVSCKSYSEWESLIKPYMEE